LSFYIDRFKGLRSICRKETFLAKQSSSYQAFVGKQWTPTLLTEHGIGIVLCMQAICIDTLDHTKSPSMHGATVEE
jgi:hypothetical protein